MNPPFYRNIQNKYRDSLQSNSPSINNNRNSKSPQNNLNIAGNKQQIVDSKIYTLNSYKFIKSSPIKSSGYLPPKAGPFQRTNRSRSKDTSIRDKSNSNVSNFTIQKQMGENKESRGRTQSVSKMTQLRKKVSQEIAEKEKWKELNAASQEKLLKMSNQLTKMKERNKYLQDQIDRINQQTIEKQKQIYALNQSAEILNKTVKTQTAQLNSLRNKDGEIDTLKNQVKKLTFDKESLSQTISALKTESQRKNMNNLQEQNLQKSQNIVKLQRQIDKLKEDLVQKVKANKTLEQNLRDLERKLYQRQSDLKKITIDLSFMGRKTAMSIDDVRSKKDLQIKLIKDKYHKVSRQMKTLKESKDKMEQLQKKKASKSKDIARRVKSSKHIRSTSESQEVTFELSQQK